MPLDVMILRKLIAASPRGEAQAPWLAEQIMKCEEIIGIREDLRREGAAAFAAYQASEKMRAAVRKTMEEDCDHLAVEERPRRTAECDNESFCLICGKEF